MVPRRRSSWLLAGLAALTGILGLLAVLAPVTADDPVVSWPRAGEQPASTVLPLAPYRPLQLQATVPCAALQALATRGGGAALRTMPADAGAAADEGLLVSVAAGQVRVRASGVHLVTEPVAPGDCTYLVRADAGGVRVERDGTGLAAVVGLLPPQVAQLETAVEGLPAASGLAVELHTDARYESSPTVLKTVLLVAHALALAALLVLAWRRWRGTGPSLVRPGLVRPRLAAADGVVVVVSLAWAVLGPVNIDDSWYLLMARNAQESGYIGNYVYQFNVTENPFSTSQYMMQAWGAAGGWGLLWMRVLPLVYGLATYALLRVLVATVLGRAGRWPAARCSTGWGPAAVWALALAHLLWFLPYGITLRPEPLIALGTAGVMVLAELARRRESVGVLAAATALAALTLTVAPTGLVACAPLALTLPWLGRWLRAADRAHRTGAVLLAGASASVVVLPGFADASLGDVLESAAVHRWYYRQYPWYEEFVHYQNLLEPSDQGAWARRLPVLLTMAVLGGAAIAAGRRAGTGGPVGRLLATSAAMTALGLASLALTPTKWVNHFGAVAAPATVLLAAVMLRSPVPRRAPAAAAALAAAAAGAAAAVGFAGPNLWRPFGDWGQPFGDHANLGTPFELSLAAPSFGPLALRNPVLWLAVALAAVWWARRARPSGLTPDRAVLTTATGLTVALLLAVFVVAPLRQYPGPSVALMNVQALTGAPCGLAGDVRVLAATGRGLDVSVGFAQPRLVQPRVVESRPITDVTAGRPVFADQVSAALWPCVDQIAVENGIASVPAVRLRGGEGLEDAISDNSVFAPNGGTLVQLDRTAEFVELPSALSPVGVPMLQWGHVELVVPDHPVGLVNLRVDRVQRGGWVRLPTLIGERYTGRSYIG